jgi:hypothetical protein
MMLTLPTTSAAPTKAAPVITDRGAQIFFPNEISFAATIEASSEIRDLRLEYGVDQRTCGTVIAIAIPEFEPGQRAEVEWTWDMRQSGSLPPGATIWYRWRATDSTGAEQVSTEQRFTWLDDQHRWQTITRGMLNLHWYEGNRSFAQELLDSAYESTERLGRDTGVTPQRQINIYIYADSASMRDAVLYEQSWTGGLAFSDYALTIMGVGQDELDWGRRVLAHELTHVLVGDRAFSCIGSIPTWLNEGIAVYGEGGPEIYSLSQLTAAIEADTIFSLRSLSGSFSTDPQLVDLSYTQSYSVVRFLIAEYGREKILDVFDRLAQGEQIEPVLNDVYGFGVDGLEDRWRDAIGAKPRQNAGIAPTPTIQPTAIPTIIPIGAESQLSASPVAIVAEPTSTAPANTTSPPSSTTPAPTSEPSAFSPLLTTVLIGSAVLLAIVLLAALGIVAVVRRTRR